MDNRFHQHIFGVHQQTRQLPSNAAITEWAEALLNLLFPQRSNAAILSAYSVEKQFWDLQQELALLLAAMDEQKISETKESAKTFFSEVPELYRVLNTDVEAILSGDPAARNAFEIIRTYPGFFAVAIYRIAHQLAIQGVDLIPRILTEMAHSRTGIDIHPNAVIGEYLYIDHGTGLVIGETCEIGDHVKLYQGVTLGALSVEKALANTKRHPTIKDHVIIYSGATILGGETVIGSECIIGGNVWLTESVPAKSTVYHQPVVKVKEIL